MGELSRISALAEELVRTDEEIAGMEESLKSMKQKRRQIAESDLPEAMDAAGMSEFKLASGRKVSLTINTYATISKKNEEPAFGWLRDHGYDDIIKRELRLLFGKGEDEKAFAVYDSLQKRPDLSDNEIISKESVHPSTLKAFVRRALADGVDIPFEVFGIHQITEAKINR